MKRILMLLTAILLALPLYGCTDVIQCDVAATTMPVYEFTSRLCLGTDITVTPIITQSISCLHDYTLQVGQMRTIQGARVVVQSGGGLEEFLEDVLNSAQKLVDASEGLSVSSGKHHHASEHVHESDPHIWLSPKNAKVMATSICTGLTEQFPIHADTFQTNLHQLLGELDALQAYGEQKLATLSCRELVTFHDGFSYLAESFDLTILRAVEEESGSEASAAELISLINTVNEHQLPAVFTETNGSVAAANIIAAETGVKVYPLDMAIAGSGYFDAMYHNINTIWEALE